MLHAPLDKFENNMGIYSEEQEEPLLQDTVIRANTRKI